MDIAEELRKAAEKSGLGIRKRAVVVGCSPSALEQWEAGFRTPGVKWAEKLAPYLQCPVETIKEELLRAHGYIKPNEHLVVEFADPTPRQSRKSVKGVSSQVQRSVKSQYQTVSFAKAAA